MMMGPRLRKFALTTHITTSVGWLGAVIGFFALAVLGLGSKDAVTVRGAYIAMGPLAWLVILPLCIASLLTGIFQSVGTTWGLRRYYWVLIKLLITVLSTLILLVHMAPIDDIAGIAAQGALRSGEHLPVRIQMIVASGGAAAALIVATGLSVYKPRGMTAYGQRKDREERATTQR